MSSPMRLALAAVALVVAVEPGWAGTVHGKVAVDYEARLLKQSTASHYSSSNTQSVSGLVAICKAEQLAWIDNCMTDGETEGECTVSSLALFKMYLQMLDR